MLPPKAFAIAIGEDEPPTDLIEKETWESIVSCSDDVSLRTSDKYGRALKESWALWGDWSCLVGGLQQAVPNPLESPIAHTACDAGDYFQASIHNALVGHYRLALTSLRAVVENMAIGLDLELAGNKASFRKWLDGEEELNFGGAADSVVKHAAVVKLEASLNAAVGDDLFHQRRGAKDLGGLVRRLFRRLSKYAHGSPLHSDAALWDASTGPIFSADAFRIWAEELITIYALAVLEARLAQPVLDKLPWGARLNAEGLFQRAITLMPPACEARAFLEGVPRDIWG